MDDSFYELAPVPMATIDAGGSVRSPNRALRALLTGSDAPLDEIRDRGDGVVAGLVERCRASGAAARYPTFIPIAGQRFRVESFALPPTPGSRVGIMLLPAPETDETSSAHELENAQRLAGVGHWRWNVETNELHWSDQIYRLFGLDPARAIATYDAFLERVHPEDRALVTRAVDEALARRRPYEIDHRIVRPDGSIRIVAERAEVTFDANGKPAAMLGTVHDVTDRMSVIATLRMSEERFRQVLESAPDAIVIADQARKITLVNSVAERLFGHSRSELLGRRIDDLVPNFSVSPPTPSAKRPPRPPTYEGVRADGSRVPLEIRSSPLVTSEGEYVVAAMRDVTDRIELESQLRQSQKMEALGLLASGVAHDFNNLLTVILCHSTLLIEKRRLPSEVVEDLQEIVEASHRASALTRQLLAFGRRQTLTLVAVDLNALAKSTTRLLRRTLGESIDLHLELDPNLPPVLADPGQIEQVILNLAVNARDAMPDGGTLSITTRRGRGASGDAGADARAVTLSVRDTGIGMDAFTRERIFDPFFTTKPRGSGTGLGLATVHGIVVQLGGSIDVETEVGSGTEFRIVLPASPDDTATEGTGTTPPRTTRHSARILVVDDDERLGSIVRRILGADGHDVRSARSAAEAWAVLDSEGADIDLLITDIGMPKETGIDLAARVAERFADMPVLFISGHAAIAPTATGRRRTAFLPKPFDAASLLAAVAGLLPVEPA